MLEILKCLYYLIQIPFIAHQSQVEHVICYPTFALKLLFIQLCAVKQLQENK